MSEPLLEIERISLPAHPGVVCQRIHGSRDWHAAGDDWQATLTAAGRIQHWPGFPALVNPGDLDALADCMREIRTRWTANPTHNQP